MRMRRSWLCAAGVGVQLDSAAAFTDAVHHLTATQPTQSSRQTLHLIISPKQEALSICCYFAVLFVGLISGEPKSPYAVQQGHTCIMRHFV